MGNGRRCGGMPIVQFSKAVACVAGLSAEALPRAAVAPARAVACATSCLETEEGVLVTLSPQKRACLPKGGNKAPRRLSGGIIIRNEAPRRPASRRDGLTSEEMALTFALLCVKWSLPPEGR